MTYVYTEMEWFSYNNFKLQIQNLKFYNSYKKVENCSCPWRGRELGPNYSYDYPIGPID